MPVVPGGRERLQRTIDALVVELDALELRLQRLESAAGPATPRNGRRQTAWSGGPIRAYDPYGSPHTPFVPGQCRPNLNGSAPDRFSARSV